MRELKTNADFLATLFVIGCQSKILAVFAKIRPFLWEVLVQVCGVLIIEEGWKQGVHNCPWCVLLPLCNKPPIQFMWWATYSSCRPYSVKGSYFWRFLAVIPMYNSNGKENPTPGEVQLSAILLYISFVKFDWFLYFLDSFPLLLSILK